MTLTVLNLKTWQSFFVLNSKPSWGPQRPEEAAHNKLTRYLPTNYGNSSIFVPKQLRAGRRFSLMEIRELSIDFRKRVSKHANGRYPFLEQSTKAGTLPWADLHLTARLYLISFAHNRSKKEVWYKHLWTLRHILLLIFYILLSNPVTVGNRVPKLNLKYIVTSKESTTTVRPRFSWNFQNCEKAVWKDTQAPHLLPKFIFLALKNSVQFLPKIFFRCNLKLIIIPFFQSFCKKIWVL